MYWIEEMVAQWFVLTPAAVVAARTGWTHGRPAVLWTFGVTWGILVCLSLLWWEFVIIDKKLVYPHNSCC